MPTQVAHVDKAEDTLLSLLSTSTSRVMGHLKSSIMPDSEIFNCYGGLKYLFF
jgi:hypothetical protein